MTLSPAFRKFTLTAHVTSSVGWLGAVAAFFALSILGLSHGDPAKERAAYLAMGAVGWLVIVPLSLASFISGVVQAVGTPWGLFRHYWVVIKLVITVLATLVLLLHMQPTTYLAGMAAHGLPLESANPIRVQLIVNAGAAIFVLLVAVALSVHKPRGLTAYGWRKQQEGRGFEGHSKR
jgi:hypothetical protein